MIGGKSPMVKGRGYKKATDQEIIDAYNKTKNIWKTGKLLNMCGQSVHERLQKLNIPSSKNFWKDDEIEIIKSKYMLYRDLGKVNDLAKQLNHSRSSLSQKAKELNLTDRFHNRLDSGFWKYMTKEDAQILFDKFKRSKFEVKQFCVRYHIGDKGKFSHTMRKFFSDEWDSLLETKSAKQSFYCLGRSFEYAVRNELRIHNFYVLRSAKSKTPIDLVAIKPEVLMFIQCKRGGTLPQAEWNELFKLAKSVNAIPILAARPTGIGTKYFILLSEKHYPRKNKVEPKLEVKLKDLSADLHDSMPG